LRGERSALYVRTHEGASFASALSVWAEHEMVDDELVFITKEVFERQGRSLGAMKLVLLVDLDHGELAHLGSEGVLCARYLLFLLEQRLASGEPLLLRNDLHSLSAHTCALYVMCKIGQRTLGAMLESFAVPR